MEEEESLVLASLIAWCLIAAGISTEIEILRRWMIVLSRRLMVARYLTGPSCRCIRYRSTLNLPRGRDRELGWFVTSCLSMFQVLVSSSLSSAKCVGLLMIVVLLSLRTELYTNWVARELGLPSILIIWLLLRLGFPCALDNLVAL